MMCAAISQSDAGSVCLSPVGSSAQRISGTGRVSFKANGAGGTSLDRLYQQGCAKIRLPRVYGGKASEAVLINSAGGLTGGDRIDWHVSAASGCYGVAASQACEKIYKSDSDVARVHTQIEVADGSRIDWLPQESILFDRSALHRSLEVNMYGSARFLALEAVLMGRLAMGERLHHTDFSDQWRVYRDGKLVHADALRLKGDATRIGASDAALSGHFAFASLCYLGPEDSEQMDQMCEGARNLVAKAGNDQACRIGLSSFNGKLVARLSAKDGLVLRKNLIPLIDFFRAGEPLPRVWTT